ncbi:hypothetical protein EJ05DRAFT_328421 [Pseudovirgaria hyperparasitica]|uniref:Uncharacterized protein n=1 Tax=Pseudovirgaria hyperparasitica TaxID=470096 RepID=A0A6A6W7W2_9PEZI|nr:uncharacterized protein EJ05DRAFT_328421 [Pseudovirgaria hyperparasitica]KAF2758988.1 hypothetical protein EJ05DRAFT_328421 [Pseudovirgaria hyperparasitica]
MRCRRRMYKHDKRSWYGMPYDASCLLIYRNSLPTTHLLTHSLPTTHSQLLTPNYPLTHKNKTIFQSHVISHFRFHSTSFYFISFPFSTCFHTPRPTSNDTISLSHSLTHSLQSHNPTNRLQYHKPSLQTSPNLQTSPSSHKNASLCSQSHTYPHTDHIHHRAICPCPPLPFPSPLSPSPNSPDSPKKTTSPPLPSLVV